MNDLLVVSMPKTMGMNDILVRNYHHIGAILTEDVDDDDNDGGMMIPAYQDPR